MWQNKYVGIPYRDNGRDETGMDCWGLARHVYNKEFNISLPSFCEDYQGDDRARITELIAQHREGWEKVTEPKSGDLVLLRILGSESHIGIITEYPYFLHAREGYSSSIEKLDNTAWKHRVVGIFRYKENASNNLVAIPNSLNTKRVTDIIPAGATLRQVHEQMQEQYGRGNKKVKALIFVNGERFDESRWDYAVKEEDRIEYRSVPTGDVGRLLLTVAVVYFTMGTGAYTLSGLMGEGFGAVGGLTSGAMQGMFAQGSFSLFALQAGVMTAGMALVNKIMPIRPPTINTPEASRSQSLINGTNNSGTPYGTIPVVLGRVRMTPPIGANSYIEPLRTESYLHMLLLWGYGPLSIEDVRAGSNLLTDYEIPAQKTIYGYGTETATDKKSLSDIYGSGSGGNDIQQVFKNIKLVGSEGGSPWQELTFTQPSKNIKLHITFPQGLRKLNNSDGSTLSAPFTCDVEFATVGSNTLITDSTWGSNVYNFGGGQFTLPDSTVTKYVDYSTIDSDGNPVTSQVPSTSTDYYQWSIIYIVRGSSGSSSISIVKGTPSETLTGEPTQALKDSIAGYLNTSTSGMTRLPALPAGAIPLYRICVRAGAVVQYEKATDYPHNAGITINGLQVTVTTGTVTGPDARSFAIGDTGQDFNKFKDAFTYTIDLPISTTAVYKVRIRRTNSGAADAAGSSYTTMHDAYIYAGTAYADADPVIDDTTTGAVYARSAYVIKATDQINGQLDAINALVTSICWDWDTTTSTWKKRGTNNPASLFRYVLQHPANAQRISDADIASRVDLAQIQYWHAYCAGKGFSFNAVLNNTRSILDVLRDICAAGRASPALVDGKWTVIIDEPKTQVVQHFSTHNSWGFEAVKPLVKIPDAFKVTFYNEAANYIQDEVYVYNTGKNASNSTVFESIEFPGVTNSYAAFRHARWHLAQLKLRPETYKLNTDLEYLVCNRGDLVRVQHDVPMWGIGTGRVVQIISPTSFRLDNEVLLQAGVTYGIRIRTASGSSTTYTLAPITQTGYYDTFTTTATQFANAVDNLVLIGTLNAESQQCLVLSVEPTTNGNASLTLVDYNPDMYNIDTSTDYPIPNFDPNISNFPSYYVPTVVQTPTIVSVVSDERALEYLGPGSLRVRIKVTYKETVGQKPLDSTVTGIDLQWKPTTSNTWSKTASETIRTDSIYATDVVEGLSYDVRVRFVRFDGIPGNWTTLTGHTVIGKSTPPAPVVLSNGNTGIVQVGYTVKLVWLANQEIDLAGYEIRSTDSGWGDAAYLFKGNSTEYVAKITALSGGSQVWYIKAYDVSGNYSTTATTITYNYSAVPNISNPSGVYSSSSLTEATVELKWTAATNSTFGIDYYEISYTDGSTAVVKQSMSTSIILPANWLGDRVFLIKTVDTLGNKSSGISLTLSKLAPNPVTNLRAQVIDNNVLLSWNYGAKTTLPVSHVLLKKGTASDTWATATLIGSKSGEFTSISELTGDTYTYFVAAVDTDGRESTPVGVSTLVSSPPDFKFNAEYTSALTGTKVNAVTYANELYMPVNTSETWQGHFTSRSWSTPSDQVLAGYPYFIQPGTTSTGYYEEVFDYGNVLGSSQITVNKIDSIVNGTATVTTDILISTDNVTYTAYLGTSSIFATNFRYIKVRVNIAPSALGVVYKLSSLKVRLDAKQKTESNSADVAIGGTIVNFDTSFIDVQSVTLTASGSQPLVAVYDLKDPTTGTYSITSNVCTVNVANHGMLVGQKVRLYFTSGTAPSGLYIIQSVTTNSYTVNIVSANTSGNVTVYANSMVVRAFVSNTAAPSAASVSYIIRGY